MSPSAAIPEFRSARPNRRRRIRHKVLTPAYASFTAESRGIVLDLNEIVDISEDGVAIQCNSPLELNRRFDLCLDLAESIGSLYTAGQVVWSSGSGRAGFRFTDLSPASSQLLREWLFLNAMAGVANAQSDAAVLVPVSEPQAPVRPNYTDTLAALTAVQREIDSLGSDLVAVLQLIAARAQTLVRASGAAIALASEDPNVMVCRAKSGADAPPVGAKLQIGSGFSGECVRAGKLLRCDDSDIDARVDRESCRALGIRSILAAPLRAGEKIVGIIEVFSPASCAFSENDSTVLQRLADAVVAAINRTARRENLPMSPPVAPAPFTPSPGSVLFASEPKEKQNGLLSSDDKSSGGIRLPRSYLILLMCAAATIFLVLGFLLAPTIQAKLQKPGSMQEQTVLASSAPPNARIPSIAPVSGPTVDTANLEQLRQLAEKGDSAAENALGLRYGQGEGVKLDEREAARWFIRSAQHGNVAAQSKLGSLYWNGRGVYQDLDKAYFWTILARAGGNDASKVLAPFIASRLTPAQAAAIEQSANVWLQRYQSSAKPAPTR